MEKFIFILFSAGILSSCAFHSGNVSTGPIIDCPMKSIVSGEAKTIKILGIGGLDKNALILEAKRDLYSKYSNTKNIKLSNFSADFKTTYIFFYSSTRVIVSADLYDCDSTTIEDTENKSASMFGGFGSGDSIIYEFNELYKGKFNFHTEDDKCMITILLPNNKTKERKVSLTSIYKTTEHPDNKNIFGYNLGEDVFIEVYVLKTKTKEIKKCKVIGLNKNRLLISYIKDDGQKRVLSVDKSLIKK